MDVLPDAEQKIETGSNINIVESIAKNFAKKLNQKKV